MIWKVVALVDNAFVKGKQIFGSALVANKAIELVLKRTNCGLLCELEIEKAYDHVIWDFFRQILHAMGLVERGSFALLVTFLQTTWLMIPLLASSGVIVVRGMRSVCLHFVYVGNEAVDIFLEIQWVEAFFWFKGPKTGGHGEIISYLPFANDNSSVL